MGVDSIGQWIASLGKGKGKRKGKQGKSDGEKGSSKGGSSTGSRYHLLQLHKERSGRLLEDGKGQDKSSGSGKAKSKGKGSGKSKGKGKAAGSIAEVEDQDAGTEPTPEADVGMLTAALSGIGIADASSASEWMKFNLDTGGAKTAIPNGREDRVTVSDGVELCSETMSERDNG